MRHTHTYVTLEISAVGYDEIARKLRDADYQHCFNSNGDIDMTGIAVTRGPEPTERRVPKADDGHEFCQNCGGTHYGSHGCPYTREEGINFRKAQMGAVEKSQVEQAGLSNEAKP